MPCRQTTTTATAAAAHMERNMLSIFQHPEDQWPTNQHSCRHNLWHFICQDLPTAFTGDVEDVLDLTISVQDNVATKLALMQLFCTGTCQTKNPSQADLFLAPHVRFSDFCSSDGCGTGCPQVACGGMNLLFKILGHCKNATKRRHLFIMFTMAPCPKGVDKSQCQARLRAASSAPLAWCCGGSDFQ
jgi:hypothetical protein